MNPAAPSRTVLGARLREARIARGLSQEALGLKAGWTIGQRQISGYESGRSVPTVATLVLLADVLAVSLDWLTGRP